MTISRINNRLPSSLIAQTSKINPSNHQDSKNNDYEVETPEFAQANQSTNRQVLDAHDTQHHINSRDADDKIIAAWFKLMKPNADKNLGFAHHTRKDDDPGRVPDPLYEPTKATVPESLKIIEFNDLMRAFAPKKPHWKHYDDTSNQFQVGSKEQD